MNEMMPPELDQADHAARSAQEQVTGRAPEAAEPLDPSWVMRVGMALQFALEHLGASDMSVPTMELGEDKLLALPPPLMSGLVTFQAAMRAAHEAGVAGAKPYARMDLNTLVTSDTGLKKLAAMLTTASKDEQLLEQLEDARPPAAVPPGRPASPPNMADMADDLED